MSFKESIMRDNLNVFLNTNEFAEKRTVIYDGNTYKSVPVVLSGIKQADRANVLESDHSEGLYVASNVMHVAISDIGGVLPEKGCKIKISDVEFPKFFTTYYIAESFNAEGMARLEIEAVEE